MSAERKKNPDLFAQASNRGKAVNKSDHYCSDNINSDYRTISMPELGKRKISGYLAMISIVERSNIDDVTKLVPPSSCEVSCCACPVLGAKIDYQLCHVCLSVRPSDRMEQLGSICTDFYEIWC
jgi:hypothetical protein